MEEGKWKAHVKLASICSIALIGSFSIGGVLVYSSTLFPKLNSNPKTLLFMDKNAESWFVSIVHLGIAAGAIITLLAIPVFGRKWILITTTLPFLTGWLIIATAEHVFWMNTGRVLTGICSGMMMSTISIYLTELAPQSSRGFYGSCHEVMVNIGVVFTCLLGGLITWQYLAITLASVIVLMVVLTVYFLPETPKWLVANKHDERAMKILSWIYGEKKFPEIWTQIKTYVQQDATETTNWTDLLFKTPQRNKFYTCMFLFILQELSGINLFSSYAIAIFDFAETSLGPNAESIIIGVIGIFGAIACAVLVDKVKKINLLVFSTLSIGMSNFIIGTYFYLEKSNDVIWLPLVALIVFTFSYFCALGSMPYLILSDNFPIKTKGSVCALAVAIKGVCAFIVTKYFVIIGVLVENYIPYFVCGSISVVGTIFVSIVVPKLENFKM